MKESKLIEADLDKFAVCDCPGFADTRGLDFEMVVALSISNAFRVADVQSIVLVIPYMSFLVDRANPVLRALKNLQAILPDAFKKGHAVQRSLFLFITKHAIEPDAAMHLKKRLETHLRDEKDRLSKLKSGSPISARLQIQEKVGIWQTLVNLHDAKQVHFMDIENKKKVRKMLNQYVTCPVVQPNYLSNPMEKSECQRNFSKHIKLSTDTWQSLIIQPYMNELPREIQEI